MAVNQITDKVSFSIEVRKGTDALGNPTYSKKSFSNVKEDAEAEKVLTVAKAIKGVLADETRNCYLNTTDILAEA